MTDYSDTKALLQSKLQELSARVDRIDDELDQPVDEDREEIAKEIGEDEVLEGVEQATRNEIRQIKSALAKLDAGTYGVCTACGKKIKPARLVALPYATKCVACMAEASA